MLDEPHRCQVGLRQKGADGKLDHNTALSGDDLRDFVNNDLFPYLRASR